MMKFFDGTNKEEHKELQRRHKLLIKMIISCKKVIPTNSLFFVLCFILKYLGVLIISHDFRPPAHIKQEEVFSFGNLLRNITFLNKTSTNNFKIQYYSCLCIAIYILVAIPYVTFFTLYRKYKSKKEAKIKKVDKLVLKISSLFFILITLLSQHLIEILSFSFYSIYVLLSQNTSIEISTMESFKELDDGLVINKYLLSVINFLAMILINISSYLYFKFSNEPFLTISSKIIFPRRNSNALIFTLFSNFQMFHYIGLIFKGKENNEINLIILAVGLTICLYQIYSIYSRFIFPNYVNYLITFIIIFTFFSGLIELTFYYTKSDAAIDENNSTGSSSAICLILFEICFSYILFHLLIYYKNKKYIANLTKNLLNKNKIIDVYALYEVSFILKNSIDNYENMKQFFLIMNEHSLICKDENCICEKFEVRKFIARFQIRNSDNIKERILIKNFLIAFLEIVVLIENELTNSITLTCNKEMYIVDRITDYMILHIDFSFYFKRNYQFCIYLKNRYMDSHSTDFMFNYHLSSLEKVMLKEVKSFGQDSNRSNDSKCLNFYDYNKILQEISHKMQDNIENFEDLIRVIKTHNDTTIKEELKENLNVENLLLKCAKLNRDNRELKDFLEQTFSEQTLKNAEICFLLHNYFLLLEKGIPPELEYIFLHLEEYESLHELETSFEEKNMRHPLILKMEKKMFVISYISQKLCDYMGYQKNELLGGDFHILLPEGFAKDHSILMKKFIFIEDRSYLKKETFMLTKEKYFYPVTITFNVLPRITENVMLIDVHPIEKNDKDLRTYFFILNKNLDLICFNKEYEEKFYLTFEMFEKLKISPLNLHGINENKILDEFGPRISKIIERNLEKVEKMIEVFKPVDLATSLKEYKKIIHHRNLGNNLNKKHKSEKTKVISLKKKSMLQNIQKLEGTILEKEFDKDWMKRVLLLQQQSYRRTSAIKLLEYRYNKEKKSNNYDTLKIELKLKSVGSEPYFQLKLSDLDYPKTVANIINVNSSKKTMPISAPQNIIIPNNTIIESFEKLKNISKFLVSSSTNNKIINNTHTPTKTHTPTQTHTPIQTKTNADSNTSANTPLKHEFNDRTTESVNISIINSSVHALMINNKLEIKHDYDDTASVFDFDSKQKFTNKKYQQKVLKALSNRKNKTACLFIFLFFCSLLLAVLNIYNFLFTDAILTKSMNVFFINYNALALKSSIIYSGASVISAYLKASGLQYESTNGFNYNINDYQYKLGLRANEIQIFSYRLKQTLGESFNIPGILKIKELMLNEGSYSRLSGYWQTSYRNSSFEDEIDFYHYLIAKMTNSEMWTTCNYKMFSDLYNNNFIEENLLKSKPKFVETLVHYVIYNLMPKFIGSFENLLIHTRSVMVDFHLQSQSSLVTLNMSILIICFMVSISLIITFFQYKSEITVQLKEMFENRPHDSVFERAIGNFKIVLMCLDNKVAAKYEHNKKSILEEGEVCIKNNKKFSKNPVKERVRLSGRLPNDLGKLYKKQNVKIETEETENEVNFKVRLFKTSIITVTAVLLIYVMITVINIVFVVTSFDQLIFASKLSLNYLERVPNFTFMVLYYKISIILNDVDFIKTPQSEYHERDYIYETFENTHKYNQETLYQSLQNSEFSYAYYLLQLNRNNIKQFLDGPYENVLPNLRRLERIINTGDFCAFVGEYVAYYFVLQSVDPDFRADFLYMSSNVSECRKIGQGVNLKGFNPALDNQLSSLTSLYLDYYNSSDKNVPIKQWLTDQNFFNAELNSETTFKKLQCVILHFMNIDMIDAYSNMKKNELIFSILQILISFSFIFYFVLYVIVKLQRYNYELESALEKYKIAINFKLPFSHSNLNVNL